MDILANITVTDCIVAAVLVMYFINGTQKGLMRTVSGPVSLAIACVAAYVYYLRTEKLLVALVISIIAPFVINFVFQAVIALLTKRKKDEPPEFGLGSLLGGVIAVLWHGTILALILIFIVMLPLQWNWYKRAQFAIQSSLTYGWINKISGERLGAVTIDFSKTAALMQDPEAVRRLQESEEVREILEDDRLQAFYRDREVAELLKEKNYVELMEHPKFKTLLRDKDLIKKLLELNRLILSEELQAETDESGGGDDAGSGGDQTSSDEKPKKKNTWAIVY